MNGIISWVAYLWLLAVEEVEEVFEWLSVGVETLQQRFQFNNSSKLLSQGGARAQRKEVI